MALCTQVLGSHAAEADELFAGEPETALIASILWAFEVRRVARLENTDAAVVSATRCGIVLV